MGMMQKNAMRALLLSLLAGCSYLEHSEHAPPQPNACTTGSEIGPSMRCRDSSGRGLVTLDRTRRTEDALYHGGQVYVPEGIDLNDVNPRPISPDRPINGLIGCFSADNRHVLAMAWDHTQELFQGVITCVHSDFRIGGLKPGQTKQIRGKIYLTRDDIESLVRRYERDFAEHLPPAAAK